MAQTLTVPRVLGGTLIVQYTLAPPPTTLVTAFARDGITQARGRDGKVQAIGRDGIVQAKGH